MITLHHLNFSRSQRILWLLEELDLPYTLVTYQRDPATYLAPPELQRVHPLGKSPVITDGALTLAESGAIIEYIVDTYGEGRLLPPPGTQHALDYRFWMHFAEGSLMPYLVMTLVFSRIKSGPMPFFARPVARAIAGKVENTLIRPTIERALDLVEAKLAGSDWLAGPALTAADIQMSFPLEAALARVPSAANRPALTAYVARLRARPAYARALEKGGPVVPPETKRRP